MPAPMTMTRSTDPSTAAGMSSSESTCTIAVAESLVIPVIMSVDQRGATLERSAEVAQVVVAIERVAVGPRT